MAIKDDIVTWKNRLLDLSKRNNLINYRDTKESTLEILFPEFNDAFNKIITNHQVTIYDTHDEVNKDLFDLDIKAYDKDIFYNKYSKKCPASQLLLFNKFMPSKKVLRALMRKASESITERGVNILYCAFGFVYWTDTFNGNLSYKSPILLIPVKLTNEASNRPFIIQQYDDDIIVNQAFKYMLKSEYGINIPDYNDEPLDVYLAKIESLINVNWCVVREARLATFSFNKLNMYLDLENNKDVIAKHPNIKILSSSNKAEIKEPKNQTQDFSRDLFIKQHNVVDADFSQTEAIEAALEGKSFVLQGPPGTGKSQTITNIIAELMYAGKKVLFVSEKMAALEIVYNNLKKVGLEEFALELHSYKANKKEFVDDLYNTLTADKTVVARKSEEIHNDLSNSLQKLNKYDELLYKVYEPINKSLYVLLANYNHYSTAEEIKYIIPNIKTCDDVYLDNCSSLLDKYIKYEKNMGYDYKENPLYGFTPKDSSYQFEITIRDLLDKAILNNNNLLIFVKNVADKYNVECNTALMLNDLLAFIEFIKNNNINNKELFKLNVIEELLNEINELKLASNNLINNLDKYKNLFKNEIFDEKLDEIYDTYLKYASGLKRLFSKKYKLLRNKLNSLLVSQQKIKYEEMVNYLNDLSLLQKNMMELDNNTVKNYNFDSYNGYETNWDSLINLLTELKGYLDKYTSFKKIKYDEDIDNQLFKKIRSSIKNYNVLDNKLKKHYDQKIVDFDSLTLLKRKDILLNTQANIDKLAAWKEYLDFINELKENNLISYVDLFLSKKYKLSGLKNSYLRCFYREWVDLILSKNSAIFNYNRITHDADIKSFIKSDKDNLEIAKYKIKAKLSSLRPDPNLQMGRSPASIIKREHSKVRKQMPIRKLFEEIPEFIQKIKPCFLMSPLSVSTFLTDNIKFDVTIFDEASQVFPEDAIVAIYRSKQLIVVGDSRQMPPTHFFMSSDYEEEYDDEASDVDSFESILDLAKTSLPEKSLLCHYRSKDESLITFSNKNFYDYRLLTYPSLNSGANDFGVDFIYVPDGYMNSKTKINIDEAEKVVDLIFDHFKNHPERSLGVVAFNIKQQDAITRICQDRRDKNPLYEKYFSADNKEPFFIKNLETVQGDERDTIIFSVTYAKNEKGVFAHRFGPLNSVGGERRLNVAITRAKLNVKVVSSIKAMDIDIKKVANAGPRLLHDYLNYAEHGNMAIDNASSISKEHEYYSPFEDDVLKFLEENGYEVSKELGNSKYKIDLAVKNPKTKEYVLAIELDGATYHSSKSARDRDRIRQSVLEGMNWKFYRIWSADWFKNNSIEKKNLLAACKKAIASSEENKPKIKEEKAPIEVVDNYVSKEETKGSVYMYENYTECKLKEVSKAKLCENVDDVVLAEAPVSINYLLKKYSYFWFDQAKITKRIVDEFERTYTTRLSIKNVDGFLYTNSSFNYAMRKNVGATLGDVEYVSPYELRNGMYAAIEYNGKCKKEDLYTFMRNQLGFSRAGEKMNKHFDKAFELLKEYVLIDNDGFININPDKKLKIIQRKI